MSLPTILQWWVQASIFSGFVAHSGAAVKSFIPVGLQSSQPIVHEVEVYYEALCPDSVKFFKQQVFPLQNDVNIRRQFHLQLYPYGNVWAFGGDPWGGRRCQHLERECFGNAWLACAQATLNHQRAMEHTLCLMDLPKHGMPDNYWNETRWTCGDYRSCVVSQCDQVISAVEKRSIDSCVEHIRNSAHGVDSLFAALERATNEANVTHVPWVVVDGEHMLAIDDLKASLLDLVQQLTPRAVHGQHWLKAQCRKHVFSVLVLCIFLGVLMVIRQVMSTRTVDAKLSAPSEQRSS